MVNLFEPYAEKFDEILNQFKLVRRGCFFEIIDSFLVEIGHRAPIAEDEMTEDFDGDNYLLILVLNQLKSLEEFDMFQRYASLKMFNRHKKDLAKYHIIWKNKKLWLKNYFPRFEKEVLSRYNQLKKPSEKV